MHPASLLALLVSSAAIALGAASDAWAAPAGALTAQGGAPAAKSGASAAKGGEMLFTRKGCIGCHALKGHEGAEGQMGPDLSKIAKERDREFLVAWIRDPQVLKPGSRMPALDLTSKEAEALADYLLSERPRKGKRR